MSAGFWRTSGIGRPRLIGHRGAAGAAAENTLPAFERAIALGVDAVELDVRVCATGELVVFHDPALDRMTGGQDAREVARVGWSALREVTIGRAERVPRLVDVLDLLGSKGIGVNVEMKRDVPDRRAVVARTAEDVRGARVPVLVSSFDPLMLRALRAIAPEVPTALLVHPSWYRAAMLRVPGPPHGRRPLACDAVNLHRHLVTAAVVARLRARGLFVNAWTVNAADEAASLAGMGVSGIISDHPSALAWKL